MAGIEKTLKSLREVNVRFDEMGKKIGTVAVATKEFNDRIVRTITRVSARFQGKQKVGETTETEELVEKKGQKGFKKFKDNFSKFGKTAKKFGKTLKGLVFPDFLSQFVSFKSIIDAISVVMAPFNALIDIFSGAISQTLGPVMEELFAVLLDPAIIEVMTLLGQIIGEVLVVGIRILIAVVNALKEVGVFDFLIGILTAVVDGISWFADNLDVVWAFIVALFKAQIEIWKTIGDFFVGIWEGIVNAFKRVADFFISIWEGVVGFFQNVADFFELIWNAIATGFIAFVNFFIGIINSVIDLLNKADFLDAFDDIPKISNISIPTVQTGAYVSRGGLVRVHDKEAILNRGQTQNLLTNDNSRQVVINFNDPVILDEENTRQLVRHFERTAARELS